LFHLAGDPVPQGDLLMRLVIEGLDVSLSKRPILHGIAMRVAAGEVVGLLGPNGAGKSTLMRAVAGLIPANGRIELDGQDLTALSPTARARLLAYLPQTRIIGWRLSVRDRVAPARLPGGAYGSSLGSEDEKIVAKALALMDAAGLAERPATELSGGEQARVLTARAVAQSTPLLIADEPASGLDP